MARHRLSEEERFNWRERYFKKRSIPQGMRNSIIIRDEATCQICGKIGQYEKRFGRFFAYEFICGKHRIPFEIDHIVPEFLGGSTTLENLRLTCRKCNRSRGYKKGGNYGATN